MHWRSLIGDSGTLASGTNAVSNERYLQIQADLASDTTRQNTPTVGEVDLTYQITSTLPSVKYYYLGSQRVAMRQGNEVYYLHGDHLGSTSLTTNVTGTVVAETRHHPFGEVRWESGSSVTDFGFTGQRNEVGFGLMDYKARFYSAGLGRFVSADTIVPDFGNSQALNRYSYVFNNPTKYSDPSGHSVCEGTSTCETKKSIALMDPGLLGYNSSNTDPLVLKFYQNPTEFHMEAGVEFYVPGASGASNSFTPFLRQGQIPDIPGNPMEGYPSGFSIHDWDRDGTPEWDRFVFTPGLTPVFRAEWGVGYIGGNPVTLETFPLPGNVNATVILNPRFNQPGQIVFQSTSAEMTINTPLGPQTQLVTFPNGSYIQFVTRQTSEHTIETKGGFYTSSGVPIGEVTYQGYYNPNASSRVPNVPSYRVP